MAVKVVDVYSRINGRKARMAETALKHFPDYKRTARSNRKDNPTTPASETPTEKEN